MAGLAAIGAVAWCAKLVNSQWPVSTTLRHIAAAPNCAAARAPCRLTAIHAIELYFNALLVHKDMDPAEVRNLKHCLSKRVDLAVENGLHLKKKTSAHLIDMTGKREYLVSRYGEEMAESMSAINRLMATLDEVGNKVTLIVTGNGATPPGQD